MWNMFKVNNEDTWMTPLASFWCLYCWLWTCFFLWTGKCQLEIMYMSHKENNNVFRKCIIKVWIQPSLTLFWCFCYCLWTDFTHYSDDFIVDFQRVNVVWEIFNLQIHYLFKGENHTDKIFFTFRKIENLAKNGLFHFVKIFHFNT